MDTSEWVVPHQEEESDDEEAQGRSEFQIEQAVEEFHDEFPIRHNVIPETDSDEDEEEHFRMRNGSNIRRGDGNLYFNQTFFNGVAFKEAVLDYALRTGRNLKQERYDKTKLAYECVGDNCEWRVYCAKSGQSEKWRIRVLKDKHTCLPNGECEMIKVPVIARLFVDKIRDEPDYFMPMKIEEIIKERWKISVSRGQCQAARNKALKWIKSEYEEQFARLRDYGAEILHSNKDSTVEVDTKKNDKGQDVFHRFYVCFEVLKRTWKESFRPIIGVDGCFLRSTMKGKFLVALGRDANNAIYPIAWACVQVENTDNWVWFVQRVKADLDLKDGNGFILISDRQKGLLKAVALELPKIKHRMCVRHIYGNLKKKHGKKKEMKPFIWNLAWSYNEADYNVNLDRLFNYDSGVYRDVMNFKPRTWCRAFYKLGTYCEDVENNSTESFNSSIVNAREMPFMPMLETVRRLAMVRISKRSLIAEEHKGVCTPYVACFLLEEYEEASSCKINKSTNGMYEAVLHGCSYRVNLEKRTCSCRKFDICGIPCEHAYGVILDKKLQVDDYVCYRFHTTTWRKNYTNGLVPMRGLRFWPTTSALVVHEPPPPIENETNKKDKKRKKGKNESPTKKQPKQLKRVMHCKVCGTANHNSRFHKKKSTQVVQGEFPQGEASQGGMTQE